MSSLFEKLIDSGAWNMLSTPTEKLLIAWFATKHPKRTLEDLLTEFPARIIIAGIGSQHKYVSRSLTTISANAEFVQAYSKLHSKSRHKTVKRRSSDQSSDGQVAFPTKERERESSPQTPFIEKGKESVCAGSTQSHTHSSSSHKKKHKGGKGKKQEVKTFPPVTLLNPEAFEQFCKIYPKKKDIKKNYEELKWHWHLLELDGWPGDVILKAVDVALASNRWIENDSLYQPNAIRFLEEEQMRDFLPKGYSPTPLPKQPKPPEQTPTEETAGMIYKLGAWWTPEELKAYAEQMIIPERLKGVIEV